MQPYIIKPDWQITVTSSSIQNQRCALTSPFADASLRIPRGESKSINQDGGERLLGRDRGAWQAIGLCEHQTVP
jgi:hypothetical protein